MSDAKFTKGPWSIFGDWGIKDKKNRLIAQFEPLNDDISIGNTKESFANAALISCAPDLYDMVHQLSTELLHMIRMENSRLLQGICSTDLDDPDYLDEESVYLAQKLLAKARGEK